MRKTILSLVLAISFICTYVPIAAIASENGTCGNNLTWVLDDTGTLNISGSGDMINWFRPTLNAPWEECSNKIEKVVINDRVTSIGNQAFYKCTSLKSVVIPQGITYIGYEAFCGCSDLSSISIASTVDSISNCAFSYCSGITDIDIPYGVKSIGDSAFSNCTSLQTVSISDSVEHIGSSCFYNCALKTIHFSGTQEQWEKLFYENNDTLPDNINVVCDNIAKTVTTSFGATVSEWAAPEIELAFENKLIPDVMLDFDMTKKVNRGEFAAIALQLYETLSNNETELPTECPFTDITGDVNEKAIKQAYGIQITAGTSNTTFEPISFINREQLATMLCRVIKKYGFKDWTLERDNEYYLNTTGAVKFEDDNDISDWAKPSVYFMSLHGIVQGVDNTHFAPKNVTTQQEASGYASATREQAIVLAQRIFLKQDMLKNN